ncbi:MAG: flavodoxin family protein, partial [Deltaproteobacteria bacterium]|nr:flavodoxin family protein [Deltaproteobacteria bacterium]
MKVLLFNGGPHEKGCVYTALAEIAATLKLEDVESQYYWLGNKAIHGCMSCWGCVDKGKCVIDDQVNEFVALAVKADGFVFGSPVHYASACGASCAFLDRVFFSSQNHKGGPVFYLKPAAAVISARRAGTTAAFDRLNKYFAISQMPIISSCYWNMVHGYTPDDVQ